MYSYIISDIDNIYIHVWDGHMYMFYMDISLYIYMQIYMHICIYIYVCVCVQLCAYIIHDDIYIYLADQKIPSWAGTRLKKKLLTEVLAAATGSETLGWLLEGSDNCPSGWSTA